VAKKGTTRKNAKRKPKNRLKDLYKSLEDELTAFEALLSKCIADALVAQLRKEADAHGVDVVTWFMRAKRQEAT
jgi:hypothetical protein